MSEHRDDGRSLLLQQTQRIAASGLLRGRLLRLFEYLRDSTLAGRVPKELEVAQAVFGRSSAQDDAMVRVYVHKLRRKLEEYQRGPGAGDPLQLLVPRGEYRLALEALRPLQPAPAAPAAAEPPAPLFPAPSAPPAPAPDLPVAAAPTLAPTPARQMPAWARLWRWPAAALAVSLALNALLAVLLLHVPRSDPAGLASSPLWGPLLTDDRPIVVLLGDYYIFGETDSNTMEIERLIRDFSINSRDELARHLQTDPGHMDRYEDLGLSYLPTSTAQVLRDVLPVLAATGRPLSVALVSELDPATLRHADIVYVGLVSGLGMLRDVVFAGSRFAVGDSYDELVDGSSGTHYFSGEELQFPGQEKYHDFGYAAAFPGPDGNHLVVIAGMRDTGLKRTGETVTSSAGIQQLGARIAPGTAGLEALYEVYGLAGSSVGARLVMAGPLATSRLWHDPAPSP